MYWHHGLKGDSISKIIATGYQDREAFLIGLTVLFLRVVLIIWLVSFLKILFNSAN
jgi:hypothetical protein